MENLIINIADFNGSLDAVIEKYGINVKYVGRGSYVLKGSALGNPFRPTAGPGSTAKLYRKWLWTKMTENDAAVLRELLQVFDGTVLVCHCANSETCHANIIHDAVEWMRKPENIEYRMDCLNVI